MLVVEVLQALGYATFKAADSVAGLAMLRSDVHTAITSRA